MRILHLFLLTSLSLSLSGNAQLRLLPVSFNGDGTVTMQDPIGFQYGKEYWFSSDSDLNEVCGQYGFGYAQPSTVKPSSVIEPVLRISGIYDSEWSLVEGKGIKSLTCEVSSLKIEREMRINKDSVTFSDLRLINFKKSWSRISFNSDGRGLCNRLGYETFVAASAAEDKENFRPFVTGKEGQIIGWEKGLFIEAITCKTRL